MWHSSLPVRSKAGAMLALSLLLPVARAAVPSPVGQWDFDDAQHPLAGLPGQDLVMHGQQQIIPGPNAEDGAVRIGPGSHHVCAHGIVPNGSGSLVNRFSLLYDFRIPQVGPWYCFFQTDPANRSDGDCFIRAGSGTIGVGQTGYSTAASKVGTWQRLIVSADHSSGIYRIYLDGELILDGTSQAIDGRFALEPTVLLFADENAEDAVIDVARVAIYDVSLTAADAAELGGVEGAVSGNPPPTIVPALAGPEDVRTGDAATYEVAAGDVDLDPVQIRFDWGDGSELSPWSASVPPGRTVSFVHAYRQPGVFRLRALARDSSGQTSDWTELQTVTVEGAVVAEFLTPPYLQNVKPDGITLMWELDAGAEAAVDYGPDTGYGSQASATGMASGYNTVIYKCVLTGLEPATTWHYRVRAGATESPDGTFTTAPDGPADFSFSVWADSQGTNHGSYGADPYEPTKSMFRHMAANAVDFAVGVGDLAENGASYSDVRQYYLDRVAVLLGQSVPWFVGWGNHDSGRNAVIRRFADLPSQDRPGFSPGYGSYSFDHAGCHFICIDNATSGSDIATWLEDDLRSAANLAAKFTFLFIHVPPYCELWIDGDASLRASLVPLMETYGVDVCFSGHTHEYSRGLRNGVYYCVTGGGSWLDTPEVLVHSWEHMTVGGYHPIAGLPTPAPGRGGGLVNEYVRVEVTEDSFTASMIAFEPDGQEIGVLDQFSKTLGGQGLPPETPRMAGPTVLDVTQTPALVLRCSVFSTPDGATQHASSVWRLSRSADPLSADQVLIEETTGADVLAWWVATDRLDPGQTVHASVRHVATDGSSSEWATPWAVRLLPDILRIVRSARTPAGLELEWTGASGPCQIQFRATLGAGAWTDVGEPIEASQSKATLPIDGPVAFHRVHSVP